MPNRRANLPLRLASYCLQRLDGYVFLSLSYGRLEEHEISRAPRLARMLVGIIIILEAFLSVAPILRFPRPRSCAIHLLSRQGLGEFRDHQRCNVVPS